MENLILALDCSLRWTNVAFACDGELLANEQLDIGRRQAAELPLIVEQTVKLSGKSWSDLRLIAVTNGPGYFTGIRVGMSYAAALAYALQLKIVPVSSLSMLACDAMHGDRQTLAIVYAGHGSVYAESFGGRDCLAAGEYRACDIVSWVEAHPEALLVSDAPERIGTEITSLSSVKKVLPNAAAVLKIAIQNTKIALAPTDLRAAYYKEPDLGVSKR